MGSYSLVDPEFQFGKMNKFWLDHGEVAQQCGCTYCH